MQSVCKIVVPRRNAKSLFQLTRQRVVGGAVAPKSNFETRRWLTTLSKPTQNANRRCLQFKNSFVKQSFQTTTVVRNVDDGEDAANEIDEVKNEKRTVNFNI
jgi:hypothetical protein